jgi:preprotein translocase subunit YajC
LISLVFIAVMLVLLWVLLIQPQRRRQQQQARLLAEIKEGDDVITLGGLYGRVQSVEDESVRLEVAPQTSVRVAKSAVAARVPEPSVDAEAPLP